MTGGLIQLKYIGDESEFFIGNPQISFFKSFYKSYGNFGKELIDIHFESPCRFGYSTYANIPIHADLINNAYLNLNINLEVNDFDLNITTDSTTTPIFSSNTNSVFNEIDSLGNNIVFLHNYIYLLDSTTINSNITNFKINEIGITNNTNLFNSTTNKIDLSNVTNNKIYYTFTKDSITYSGVIYIKFIKEDLTKFIKEITFEIDEYVIEKHNTDWLLAYNKLLNNSESSNTINNNIKTITPSMFNKNIQLYIPLRFCFTKSTTTAFPIAALYHSDVNIKIHVNKIEDIFVINKSIKNININNARLSINYIYLDDDEKKFFLKNRHELLIEQVQHQTNTIINNIDNNVELYFNYLCKYIIWKLPYKYILKSGKIIFNNNDLLYEQEGEYFHLIQPLEYNLGNTESFTRMEENTDMNGTYYVYSFSINPLDRQPSGLCNMSRIDDKFLQLHTTYIKNTLNLNSKLDIEVFAVNYNFLEIENGKCKLKY